MHAARAAPAESRRGRPLPVPAGRLLGRSSNVFLQNGARLYLDVGSHPEYATPECDSLYELVVHDKAGERILESLVESAEQRLPRRRSAARSTCSRTTPIRPATAMAATRTTHEPPRRSRSLRRGADPVPGQPPDLHRRRQGAADGARRDVLDRPARRAHLGGCRSATTRSRPIINTRDEPHADAERYRRLHVIVGDSNMSEYTTFLKVGAARACCGCSRTAGRAPRHDSGEPDPGDPRDQPRHDVPAQGPSRPTAARSPHSTSSASTSIGRCGTPTPRASRRSSRRRWRCGSTASRRSRTIR